MPHPIHVRSGLAQKWAGWFLHTGFLPDRIHLTKMWHSQPESNWIWPGFAQCDLDSLWENTTESKSEKLVVGWLLSARNWAKWFLRTGLLLDQMHLSQTWPGHPDLIRVSFAQYGPGFLWKNGTKSDVGSWIQHIRSGPILAVCWP